MKKILWKIILFLPFGIISCNQNQEPQLIVSNVYDGDTVYFNDGNLKGRIFGIDAPELKDQFWNLTTGIRYKTALLSKNNLFKLLVNKKIEIIKITIDKYNRNIIKMRADNQDVGLQMVKLGMAKVAYISHKKNNKFFSRDEVYYQKLLDAQYYAFKKQIGIWSRKNFYKKIFPKL